LLVVVAEQVELSVAHAKEQALVVLGDLELLLELLEETLLLNPQLLLRLEIVTQLQSEAEAVAVDMETAVLKALIPYLAQ